MIDWLKRDVLDPHIELGTTSLPIVLRRHAKARRLTLRLAPDGSEVRITMPAWARTAEAIDFARSRREWLTIQHNKIPQRTAPGPNTQLSYRGDLVRVDWHEDHPRKPALDQDVIRLGGPNTSLERRLRVWFEKSALALFETDVADYCTAAQLTAVPVALSRAQKRWGSCSDRQRIRLNWRLVQAPDWVRRSVVAHEVTHLVHFDHSPAFHTLLGDLFEGDIDQADAWLKENGRSLYTHFG
jgi:predicted metal-dependent hydrolase